MSQEMNRARFNLRLAEAKLDYTLEVFGDEIARREGYRDLDGFEAISFYLIHKHNWLPRDVAVMSYSELRSVLCQEMDGWILPDDAIPADDWEER